MRRFSFAPALTMSGRKNKGLRGLAGKPYHPPLTDIPVAAYMFTAAFDVLSLALHSGHPVVARQLFVAATWTLLGGAVVSVLAALTGWADWHRSSEPGTGLKAVVRDVATNVRDSNLFSVVRDVTAPAGATITYTNDRGQPETIILRVEVVPAG